MPPWLQAIAGFFGFGQKVAEVIEKVQDAKKENVNRDLAAAAQRETTNETELEAMRRDRVRGANEQLQQRTRAEYGIDSPP